MELAQNPGGPPEDDEKNSGDEGNLDSDSDAPGPSKKGKKTGQKKIAENSQRGGVFLVAISRETRSLGPQKKF